MCVLSNSWAELFVHASSGHLKGKLYHRQRGWQWLSPGVKGIHFTKESNLILLNTCLIVNSIEEFSK